MIIGSGVSGRDVPAVRAVARPAPAECAAATPGASPGAAPLPAGVSGPVPDAVRDARFDALAATPEAHRIRRIVQQLTAAAAYGGHVSVISTGTTIHATIDISG